MPVVVCPQCGEGKRLRGRREEDVIQVECLACGHEWLRTPGICSRCGGPLDAFRMPVLQKARGTQQSILAYRIVKRCVPCEGAPPPPDLSATLDAPQG
jgi:uncharacterized metal-binding protein (TIGR02443 family)